MVEFAPGFAPSWLQREYAFVDRIRTFGTGEDDTLSGMAGIAGDTIERVYGLGGDDVLSDGAGTTFLFGGDGADTFVLSPDGVADHVKDFETARDRIDLSAWGVWDFAQLERIGSPTRPTYTFADQKLHVKSDGLLSADHFIFAAPPSPVPALVEMAAGERNLILVDGMSDAVGNDAGNRITGNEGANVIDGAGGDDRVFGGDGNDVLSGGDGRDVLYGGTGSDILSGGDGRDILYGGNDNDTLIGGTGRDVLFGGGGSDIFVLADDGLPDRISFQPFVDVIDVRAWDVTRFEDMDVSRDFVRNVTILHFAGQGAVLNGNVNLEGDFQAPSPEDNFIFAPPNRLEGTDGDDKLVGGRVTDILTDGAGRDVLVGGKGRDTFILDADGELDWIKDFDSRIDLIDLRDWEVTDMGLVTMEQHRNGAWILSYGDEVLFIRETDDRPLAAQSLRIVYSEIDLEEIIEHEAAAFD